MARALWADIRHQGAVQGGSTITQQFVKNSLTGNDPTITRKLKEAALAWQLEQDWDKDQILTAYLNTIYFGNGAYGIERAARTYFGHTAARLNLPEAALLAGIPEDPSLYDPVAHPVAAKTRRTTVLRLMLAQGVINAARVPLRRSGADAEAAERPSLRRAGRRTVLRRVREGAADRQARREARVRRRLPRQHDDRPPAADARADGDRQVAAEPRPARRRRSSRSIRRPARCSRCTAAATSTRASSTSQCRASGSRARRSSRSCSRPR